MRKFSNRQCVTHHFACDCREQMFAAAVETHNRVIEWQNLSDEELRLRLGEITAQEKRSILAALDAILPRAKAVDFGAIKL